MKHSRLTGIGKIAAVIAVAVASMMSPVIAAAGKPAGPQPPFTPDFFGMSVGADLTKENPALFDNEMNLMHLIGVHWVRAVIPWSLVEHDFAGEGNWLLIDRLVNMVQAEGMQLDAIVDAPPLWAYQSPRPVSNCSAPADFDVFSYADFVAAVATRYGSARVPVIELENAPNLPGAGKPWQNVNACAYTRLMQASYAAIKAVDSNITVLTGGLGAQNNSRGGVAGETFLQQMYQYGAHGSFDAVSWHPYSYPCFPSMSCPKVRPWYRTSVVRKAMVDNGDGSKLMWATEFGAPTDGLASDGHVNENNQAAMMVNAMKNWVAFPWAGPFFVFEMRDTGGAVAQKRNWFGVISHDSKHKKIAFYAYKYEATGHTSYPLPQNVIDGTPGP